MGCVYSSVEKEESVRRCRERRRLMKQLMACRSELAAAHLAYLQALRNTGATLRQFAEDGDGSMSPAAPPRARLLRRSPLPLPPSPPPPPPFSPESRRGDGGEEAAGIGNDGKMSPLGDDLADCITNDGSSGACTPPPPPPPPPPPSWDFWEPPDVALSPNPSLLAAPLRRGGLAEMQAVAEEETWAETNTEFAEEEKGGDGRLAEVNLVLGSLVERTDGCGFSLADDNSSVVSGATKDTDRAMVVWRSRRTLAAMAKELDEYFLKASAGGTEVMSLLESSRSNCLDFVSKGKRNKSAKVFSSLSWRWSYRSPLSSKDASELQTVSDHCQSGSHCMTLEKIHVEEKKLYKVVKDEEVTKVRHKRKVLQLHKQEAREQDGGTREKTRVKIEELDHKIRCLQELISGTCLSISKLRDEELHPQIITLSSRLLKMWRTMYECHQVQNHVAQQATHIIYPLNYDPTSDAHRHATTQLEAEVNSLYDAFHKLLKSQREYAHTLNKWVKLTDCLPNTQLYEPLDGIYILCEEWQVALDRLPDKVAAEAIKSFISVIHSIDLQLSEEHKLRKKAEFLEKKLEKQAALLGESEVGHEGHQASTVVPKQAKLDSLRKRVAEEKSKHLNSIRTSRAMMLNNLQTGLPDFFQAMTGFSGVCVQAFQSICQHSHRNACEVSCN